MFSSLARKIKNKLLDVKQMIASEIQSGVQRVAATNITKKAKKRVKVFTDWISSKVKLTQVPQVLNEVVENVEKDLRKRKTPNFTLREEVSAFREFTSQHVIDGETGWGSEEFLEACKESMTSFLRTHRNTKIKIVVTSEFVKKQVINGKKEYKRCCFAFSSQHEINARETDVDELYQKMVDKVMENFGLFLMGESG